jgi:hypothetical protein
MISRQSHCERTKRMLDLADKDFNPVLGMVKNVFETNKRYPEQFPQKTKRKFSV